jgi:hypothetical protein
MGGWKVDYSPPVLALDEQSASSDTEAVDFERTDQAPTLYNNNIAQEVNLLL